MQNLATVLDGDLESAAIQLGKALIDPAGGLTALNAFEIHTHGLVWAPEFNPEK